MWSVLLVCSFITVPAQQPSDSLVSGKISDAPPAQGEGQSAPVLQGAGVVISAVKDLNNAAVPGASVTLAAEASSQTQSTQSDSEGAFSFAVVKSGSFRLTVISPGFDLWSTSVVLRRGENLQLPDIDLSLSSVNTDVEVHASKTEIAAAQLGLEEKQRVLGVFPNFYASYIPNPDPLTSRQKFSLAWRFAVDPVAFVMTGVIAGAEQSQNSFSGYGRGPEGYVKRFGATYTDAFTSTMMGQAILPSVLHQDPRYFVKGTGSVRSRALYAIATTVICKGDDGHWQLNYSNILGNAASAGISNLYYPSTSRHGAGLTIQNSLITTALGAVGGIFQEFFLHRMTPNIPDYGSGQPK